MNLVLFIIDGRRDSQVKINGIRIELSEIERQIEKLQYINKAVVMLSDINPEQKQLEAYLSAAQNTSADIIRTELVRFLPGYMIPSHIFFIKTFPTSANGKIDRKKLRLINPEKQRASLPTNTGTSAARRDSMRRNVQRIKNIRKNQ